MAHYIYILLIVFAVFIGWKIVKTILVKGILLLAAIAFIIYLFASDLNL